MTGRVIVRLQIRDGVGRAQVCSAVAAGRQACSYAFAVDLAIAFETTLPHGLCVGVRFAAGARTGAEASVAVVVESTVMPGVVVGLSAEEQRYAATLRYHRRTTWIAGRLAMRAALARLGVGAEAIMATERGAPVLPPGVVGSISHKRELAVAMVTADAGWTLGVDIERCAASAYELGRRVLAEPERAELAGLDDADRGLAVMLRFSLKEAIYKAIDPVLRRYVGFREVMVTPAADGVAEVRHCLELPLDIEAWWTLREEHFLTSARARLEG